MHRKNGFAGESRSRQRDGRLASNRISAARLRSPRAQLRLAAMEVMESRLLFSFYTSAAIPADFASTSVSSEVVTGINNSGVFVGYGTESGTNTAFFGTSPDNLDSISNAGNTQGSNQAFAIDSAGMAVGADANGSFIVDTGSPGNATTVDAGSGDILYAVALRGSSDLTGGQFTVNNTQHPVLHHNVGTAFDLTPSADLSSTSFSGAVLGLDKRAVGWITGANGGTKHAAVQSSDDSTEALQDISGSFSGSGDSEALAIDDSNTVVGYATFAGSGNAPQPFLYNANTGAVTRIPNLPGFNQGEAEAVTQLTGGDEMVTGWESNGSKKAAFVYDATTGVMQNLNALTDADDGNYSVTLTDAPGINASGMIVANYLDSSTGDSRAFVLTPSAQFVAESTEPFDYNAGATLQSLTPVGNGQSIAVGYASGGESFTNNGYVGNYVLYKFNSDGSKDTTFGSDGRVQLSNFNGAGYGVTIDPTSGDILLAGTKITATTTGDQGTLVPTRTDWVIARFDSNGNLRSNFGSGGFADLGAAQGLSGDATLTFTGDDGAATMEAANTPYGIAIDSSGRIVVSGTYENSQDSTNTHAQFAVVRLLSNGSLDTSFNPSGAVPGVVKTAFSQAMYPASGSDPGGGDDHGGRDLVQPDGKILVAGESGGRVALVRYLSNGSLDPSFDPNYGHGLARITEAQSVDWNVGLAEQADGKILIAAKTSSGDFAVVRLNSDDSLDDGGSFDTTPGDHFGTANGMATVNFGGGSSADADEVIAQPGGQIDVLGTSYDGSTVSAAIAILSSSGAVQSQQTYGDPGVSSALIHPDLGAAGAALFEAFGAPQSNGTIITGLGRGAVGMTVGNTAIHPGINIDTTRPTATLDSITSIPNGVAVRVTYADDVAINLSSLDANDISVTGAKTLTVGAPQVVDSFTGRPTVVYDLTDPAGWTAADDGNFTIALNSNQAFNSGGTPASMQTLGAFSLHSIAGNVFNDTNGDGVKQGGEAGAAGVTVYADINNTGSASGQPQVTTDASGNYSLAALVSGANYTIRQDLPAGVIQTAPSGGNGQVVALGTSDVANENFGREQTTGLSIAGSVFADLNANGTQDAGEAGVSGIVVYADLNSSGNPTGQPQFTTDSSGHYNISGLSPNTTYTVRLVLPTGFTQTSPAANAGLTVSLGAASVGNESFGVKGAGSSGLSGKVFNGLTGAPLPGITVFLDANGNGTLDSGEISDITDSLGGYNFANLAAGNYAVVEILPSGQTASAASVNVAVGAGSTTGPSFADVPTGVVPGTTAPNLTGKFVTSPPASVISGSKGKLMLQISNTGTAKAVGTITIALFASSTSTLAGATKIIDVPVRLNLKPHGAIRVPLNFKYPAGLPSGKYSIIASIDANNAIPELSETDNLEASNPVTIAPAFVSLTSTLFVPAFVASSQKISISTVVHNGGNIPAAGPLGVAVAVSTSPDGSNATPVTSFTPRINIKAGKSQKLRFNLRMPSNLSAGSLYFVVTLDSAHKFGANAVVLLSSAVTVVT